MPALINSKKEFELLEFKHGVPKVIWCYWAGGPMNESRSKSFEVLLTNIGVTVCLVNRENAIDFVQKKNPLHPAFEYLSAVHQSDYLRAYLLHHYGGGWHDIKATLMNYEKVWDHFSDPNFYLVGKPEVKGGPAKVFDQDGRWMPDFWQELVSAIAWVGRPNTPLSRDLLNTMGAHLDVHFEMLKKNPGIHPREKKLEASNPLIKIFKTIEFRIKGKNPNYPLQWTFFGNCFHPLNYHYKNHISNLLPVDEEKNAGIYHR
ncbi:capsular polysaccharide synthesis protein [Algoriphagus sp.]|uniref:capsular polysaccharide synthesis protein n=1 Tax=Algoriphagus sp. TaxID=1872435 RepID=UPI00391886F0